MGNRTKQNTMFFCRQADTDINLPRNAHYLVVEYNWKEAIHYTAPQGGVNMDGETWVHIINGVRVAVGIAAAILARFL